MTGDLRARVRAALSAQATARGLDPDRNETATVPLNAATDAVMAALGEGCEWLMSQAEQYQARAHAAELALLDEGERRPLLPFGINPLAVLCAVAACGAASLVQWLTGSQVRGDLAGLFSLFGTVPFAVWARRRWRAKRHEGAGHA